VRRAFWQRLSQRPDARLTAHFFGSMFDFGVLTPAGADSVVHLSLGAVGALLALALRFALSYAGKYSALSAARSPEPYRVALLGDDLFMLAAPMLLIALLTVIVSQSLFPDERDFRILGPLPIRRIVIFRAKLAALVLFSGMFAGVLHIALAPVMFVMSASRYSESTVLLRLTTWSAASVAGSIFSVLAVAATVGGLTLALSRTRLHSLTAIARSLIFALLIVCVPFVLRLPGLGSALAHGRPWLAIVPPAWFVGLQRTLLGSSDPSLQHLATLALAGLLTSALIVAVAYLLLFRHFEHLLLRRPSISPPWSFRSNTRDRLQKGGPTWLNSISPSDPVFERSTDSLRQPCAVASCIKVYSSGCQHAALRSPRTVWSGRDGLIAPSCQCTVRPFWITWHCGRRLR